MPKPLPLDPAVTSGSPAVNPQRHKGGRPGKKPVAIWLVVLIVLYGLARGPLERVLGIKLPHIPIPAMQQDEPGPVARPEGNGPSPDAASQTRNAPGQGPSADNRASVQPGRPSGTGAAAGEPPADNSGRRAKGASNAPNDKERLGVLTDAGRGALKSTAGLLYRPGSQEGHRTKHILKHHEDDPDRPGSHGVFEGTEDEVFAVIDEAYQLAQAGGPGVTQERDGDRTVYEVNLNRRIGYVGGQSGNRRGKPAAKYVRLVIEGENELITAFPISR